MEKVIKKQKRKNSRIEYYYIPSAEIKWLMQTSRIWLIIFSRWTIFIAKFRKWNFISQKTKRTFVSRINTAFPVWTPPQQTSKSLESKPAISMRPNEATFASPKIGGVLVSIFVGSDEALLPETGWPVQWLRKERYQLFSH